MQTFKDINDNENLVPQQMGGVGGGGCIRISKKSFRGEKKMRSTSLNPIPLIYKINFTFFAFDQR